MAYVTKAPTTRPVWHGPAALKKLLVPIGLLAPHPSNPRKHDLPAIMESLKTLGQQKPIVIVPVGRVNPEFQTIVAGHGTTFGARELGWSHVAAVESDLEDADIERFVLADNRTSDRAGYDDDVLAKLLSEVQERGGLTGTGYDRSDLDTLLTSLAHRNIVNAHVDGVLPPIPDNPKSKVGERYELGSHVVVCGDAFNEDHHKLLLGAAKPNCILTDPPYGINLNTDYTQHPHGSSRAEIKLAAARRSYPAVIGDDAAFDATWLVQRYSRVKEQFWFGGDYYRRTLSTDDRDGSYLVWDKRTTEAGGTTSDLRIGSGFELIWSRQPHKRDLLRHFWNGAFGAADARNRMHPTQKPLALLNEILERWTKPGWVVLDPFAGSGSTLIACESLGRAARVMELSPAYCDVIRHRYADLTNQPDLAP